MTRAVYQICGPSLFPIIKDFRAYAIARSIPSKPLALAIATASGEAQNPKVKK